METMRSDLAGCPVIIGGGLAGLMTALRLAPRPVHPAGQGAAGRRRGVGLGAGRHRRRRGRRRPPALHAADTLAAGAGLSDPAVAGRIAAAAPAAIIELERHGVVFDRDADGRLALGLEAAHGRRRIVHVAGDGTGAAIMRALVAAVQATPSITVIEGTGSAPPAGRRPRDRRRAGGRPVRRLPAAEPPGRAGDRRDGRALRPHDQSAGRHRPGPGAGRAGRRGAWPTWSSCSSIPPPSMSGSIPCRWSARPCAARARCWSTRPARASWRAKVAASSRRATSSRAPWRPTSRPAIASSSMRAPALGADFAGAFSRHRGALPRRRHRSRAPADPGAAGGALPHGRHRRGRRGPQHHRGPVGLRRGRRQPACTAPTGWPATRCSRPWSWRAPWPTASPAPPAGAAARGAAGRPAAGRRRRSPARPDQRDAGRGARPRRPRARGRPSAAARLQGGGAADPALVGADDRDCRAAREESRGGHWRADFPQASPAGRAAWSSASTTPARSSSAGPCRFPPSRNLSSPEPEP